MPTLRFSQIFHNVLLFVTRSSDALVAEVASVWCRGLGLCANAPPTDASISCRRHLVEIASVILKFRSLV